jgi:dihydrolipoamide dehydrogenase
MRRTTVPYIFRHREDIVGQSLAHKRHDVAAAEVIAGELQGNKELASAAFNACANFARVAYTDPEVAWVGLTEWAKGPGHQGKRSVPVTVSAANTANGRDEG